MGYDREPRSGGGSADPASATGGTAAGKRALTDRLAQRAAKKNPVQQAKLGFKRDALSAAPVDSQEFAHDVADKQVAHGLRVDGVAGRKTVKAVIGNEFDYLDTADSKGGDKGGRGKRLKSPTTKGQPLQLLAALETNSYEDEHQFAAVIGSNDGVTTDATFQVTYASGHPVPGIDATIVAIHGGTTLLRASRGRAVFPPDAGVLVTIPAPPELEHHADGSIGDDHDDRLES
jgi:hypothetical protein